MACFGPARSPAASCGATLARCCRLTSLDRDRVRRRLSLRLRILVSFDHERFHAGPIAARTPAPPVGADRADAALLAALCGRLPTPLWQRVYPADRVVGNDRLPR